MNDTVEVETAATAEEAQSVLRQLKVNSMQMTEVAHEIISLLESSQFQYLSKEKRNALLSTIVNLAGNIFDFSKLSQRKIKKVKRVKVPEHVVDSLLRNDALNKAKPGTQQ